MTLITPHRKLEFVRDNSGIIKDALPHIARSYPDGLSNEVQLLAKVARRSLRYPHKVATCDIVWEMKELYNRLINGN